MVESDRGVAETEVSQSVATVAQHQHSHKAYTIDLHKADFVQSCLLNVSESFILPIKSSIKLSLILPVGSMNTLGLFNKS
jgi:hypothetical protein